MIEETILQHWIFTQFAFPFLLVFFIVYGILIKTKLMGEDKQLNALIAFVIGLIFVTAISPKLVVSNMILFLTVAIIVVFVALLIWGFIAGEKGLQFENAPKGLKWFIGIGVILAVFFGVLWAANISSGTLIGNLFNSLFHSSWSSSFWTNVLFVGVVIVALALILIKGKGS